MDVFEVFKIKKSFNIDNLDKIYYSLYKNADNKQKEEINHAYLILKNPYSRICSLCETFPVDINLEEIFKIIEEQKNLNEYLDDLLQKVYESARNDENEKCSILLEKYKYLKKFHRTDM